MFKFIKQLSKCFPSWSYHFIFLLALHESFWWVMFSYSFSFLELLAFLILAILKDVRGYLIVALVTISLLANHIERLFMCLVAYLLLWSVRSNLSLSHFSFFLNLLLARSRILYRFWIRVHFRYTFSEYFLPLFVLPFYFLNRLKFLIFIPAYQYFLLWLRFFCVPG